ncbi:MAG: hypothetical protein ACOYEJ_09415 [Mahellales bacterium]|jgi:hypothetical protein
MNISDKARRRIILGIGLALVLFGVVQGVFDLEVNENFSRNFSFILMMAALVLLFGGRKRKPQPEDEEDGQEQNGEEQKEDQDEENQ